MIIFVSGAFGYLGSTLVPTLLAQGHRVLALDDLRYGNGAALAHVMCDPNLEVHVGDCRSEEVVLPLLKRADVIIPLAAIVGAPACARDSLAALSTNTGAIATLCVYAQPDQLIVFPNTNSGYGRTGDEAITEDAPLNPITHYGRTKCKAEALVLSQPNGIILRLATVYGFSPRMRLDLLVNDFAMRAVRDRALTLFEGHHRRSVVHVTDVAGAFLHVIDARMNYAPGHSPINDRVYNVVGENVTKRSLCERLQKLVPGFVFHEAEVGHDPDQRDYAVSSARLRATGWVPRVSLDDGLAELVKGLPALLPRSLYGNI